MSQCFEQHPEYYKSSLQDQPPAPEAETESVANADAIVANAPDSPETAVADNVVTAQESLVAAVDDNVVTAQESLVAAVDDNVAAAVEPAGSSG